MAIFWVLLGVISGACIAVQAPINAQLGRTLGLPFAAAFVSFAAGAVILAIVTFGVAWATGTTIALPPEAVILRTTSAAPASSMSSAATFAPCCANACAVQAPIPCAAPVTATTRPDNSG